MLAVLTGGDLLNGGDLRASAAALMGNIVLIVVGANVDSPVDIGIVVPAEADQSAGADVLKNVLKPFRLTHAFFQRAGVLGDKSLFHSAAMAVHRFRPEIGIQSLRNRTVLRGTVGLYDVVGFGAFHVVRIA